MSLKLSSTHTPHSQKAATAFYENGIAFEPMIVGEDATVASTLRH